MQLKLLPVAQSYLQGPCHAVAPATPQADVLLVLTGVYGVQMSASSAVCKHMPAGKHTEQQAWASLARPYGSADIARTHCTVVDCHYGFTSLLRQFDDFLHWYVHIDLQARAVQS